MKIRSRLKEIFLYLMFHKVIGYYFQVFLLIFVLFPYLGILDFIEDVRNLFGKPRR